MWDCTKMYFVVAQCASSLRVSVVICVFRALWYNDILNIWKSPRSLSFICNCFLERTLPNTNVITFLLALFTVCNWSLQEKYLLGPLSPISHLPFWFDIFIWNIWMLSTLQLQWNEERAAWAPVSDFRCFTLLNATRSANQRRNPIETIYQYIWASG